MTTALFTRTGQAATKVVLLDGKPVQPERKICTRCGGAGGSDRWIMTGWSCFDCQGKGWRGDYRYLPLYSQEKLDKLNATKAKRDATRAAKAAAAAEVEAARVQAERAQVLADHSAFLARAKGWSDPFILDLVAQLEGRARPLSQNQLEAGEAKLDRLQAEKDRLEAAAYIGEVGERREFELELVRAIDLPDYGFGSSTLYVCRCDGSTVVYKGAGNPLGFHWTRDDARGFEGYAPGQRAAVKATVKAHTPNRKTGEPETTIARPAAKKAA